MRSVFITTLAIAAALLVRSVAFHAAPSTKTPVSASFRCSGGTPSDEEDPANFCPNGGDPNGGDRLAGDNDGPYVGVPIDRKTPAQNAYITSEGQFWFAQQQELGRSVFFDFSEVLTLPQPVLRRFTTAWSTGFHPNWLASPIGVANGFWGMQQGQQVDGVLKADFQNAYDSYRWTVRFNPAQFAASTYLTITCRTRPAESASCLAWTIEATASHVAQLIASTTSGKYIVYDEGTYRMPFAIDITYP